MNLELDEKDVELQICWKAFADEYVTPAAISTERTGTLDDSILARMREFRLLEGFLPTALGGSDLPLFTLTLLLEEIAACFPALAMLIAQQVIIGIRCNSRAFNFDAKDEMAKKAALFEEIYSLAATETEAGCDLGGIVTAAEPASGGYVINGGKAYVNWAARAAWFLTLVKGQKPDGGQGYSMFAIPACLMNKTEFRRIETMGMSGLEACPVEFRNITVESDALAGVYGYGLDVYNRVIDELRIAAASIAVGTARRAFDEAVKYGKTRKQFGKPVGSFQSLQWRFADAALKVDAARLHVWQAVEFTGNKTACPARTAMAKVFAAEAACEVTDFAVQVLGSRGYAKPSDAERMFRDARFLKIAFGTSEILRNRISESLNIL